MASGSESEVEDVKSEFSRRGRSWTSEVGAIVHRHIPNIANRRHNGLSDVKRCETCTLKAKLFDKPLSYCSPERLNTLFTAKETSPRRLLTGRARKCKLNLWSYTTRCTFGPIRVFPPNPSYQILA
jgi:hypothetical protein